MQFLSEYAYAATVSATFSYDCTPFYKAVRDSNNRIKDNAGQKGHVIIHWL